MAKSFEFPLADNVDVDALMTKAKTEARSSGIVIEGDDAAGRFKGTAEGTYAVDGSLLRVEVTNKPAIVPWKLVENALRKVFS